MDMNEIVVIIGNGLDLDLGLEISFKKYTENIYCIACYSEYGEKWSDFENYLRKRVLEITESTPKEVVKSINDEWIAFKLHLSHFFSAALTTFKCKKDSYAYHFLSHLTSKTKVYTFNYTNPYEYVGLKQRVDFQFIHGRYYMDTFGKGRMLMSQSPSLIVGIDYNRIPEYIKGNENIRHLIKQLNKEYIPTDIVKDLKNAKIVVFFGFSMGLPDADYFDEFFSTIIKEQTSCQKIYCITYDSKSFFSFKKNINTICRGVDIVEKKVEIIPIYTKNRDSEELFTELLLQV